MVKINENYLKLQSGYLFPEINRRVNNFLEGNSGTAKNLIRCGIGDVTEPLPESACSAMNRAIADQKNRKSFHGYGPEQGYAFLREAIAKNKYSELGVDIIADEIFISDGSKCDTGNILDIFGKENKIAVMNPVYPVYVDTNVMAGNTGPYMGDGKFEGLVYMDCTIENNFSPSPPNEAVDLIYLCYPNNPTGSTISREDLQKWVDFAIKNKAVILYDSAYEAFIQDENVPRSIFEIPKARECAIEFCSFSKNGGFTGVRCAYTVIPKELCAYSQDGKRHKLHSMWNRRMATKFNGASYIVQRGAEALFSEEGKLEIADLIKHYMSNAEALKKACEDKGLMVFGGVNAPYLWIKCPDSLDSWQTFDYFLEKLNIVITPGVGFGSAGEGYFRISAFNSKENINEVIERLKRINF